MAYEELPEFPKTLKSSYVPFTYTRNVFNGESDLILTLPVREPSEVFDEFKVKPLNVI